jgi:ectoine hydroxylase-related dioxygenase (phytanoyl-CoA dioxygenase family)
MLTDFTGENGATRILPGSHRKMAWPAPDDADPPGMVQATGPAGTLLVFDGRVWHGTGSSRVDEKRFGMLCYCCRPWVRQQENFTLTVAPEVLEACPQALRDRLGFRVWRTLGRAFGGAHHGSIVERPTNFVTEVRP